MAESQKAAEAELGHEEEEWDIPIEVPGECSGSSSDGFPIAVKDNAEDDM
jgi:hypothetical protein